MKLFATARDTGTAYDEGRFYAAYARAAPATSRLSSTLVFPEATAFAGSGRLSGVR